MQIGPTNEAYSTGVTLTLPAPSTKGTLLVATLAADGTGSFTAPAGWVRASTMSNGTLSDVWYYPNNPGGITSASFSVSTSDATAGALSEWSGVVLTSPVDATGTANQQASPSTTETVVGSTNDAAAGDLAVAVFDPKLNGGGALTETPCVGWTQLGSGGGTDWFHFAFDYQMNVPAGSVSDAETASVSSYWTAALASFK